MARKAKGDDVKKPRLKALFETLMGAQEAASAVVMAAARLWGAVQAHCDSLEDIAPNATRLMREVGGREYEAMREAMNRLYEI